jgi:hypothetical protein
MKRNYGDAVYGPVEKKTFRSALMQFLSREFPHMGGPMILQLFVDQVERLIEEFYPPTQHLKMGQLLWFAVAKEERHSYGKSMEQTQIVPVVLTLVNHDDLSKIKSRTPLPTLKKEIQARLYREADQQGGTLSEIDVALITLSSLITVTKNTLAYEKEHGTTLPRRGTIHDMGRSISHKATICKKRKLEKKSTSLVAQETSHSPEAVDRYTLNLDRVSFCLGRNLSPEDTSFVTGLSKNLVIEYRHLAQDIHNASVPNSSLDTLKDDDLPF